MLILLRVILLRRLYIIMIGVYNLYYSAQVEVHYKSNHQAYLFPMPGCSAVMSFHSHTSLLSALTDMCLSLRVSIL